MHSGKNWKFPRMNTHSSTLSASTLAIPGKLQRGPVTISGVTISVGKNMNPT